VRPETYRTLLDAFRASPGRIVIPICEDTKTGRTTRGHPVVVPAEMLTEIVAAPDDTTLRDLIRREADMVLEVRVEDAGVLKDVDTLADLKELGGTEV
jgi:molybdenum cofactor cytidylyltransferase